MKKTFRYIFLSTALLAGLTGCVKETLEPTVGGDLLYPSDGKALVSFTVAVPGAVSTKAAMADTPTIENMRVAVFGSSGFLKEAVDIDEFTPATTNGPSPLYTFKARLSLTDSKNLRVHVIANLGDVLLPWKYDSEVMTTYAYTSGGQDAYWASFTLPNGVTLKKEYDEESASMVYVKDSDGYYQVTDDVTDAFCGGTGRPGLALVRNFAKISIQSVTPQFVLDKTKTLAIINKPDRGSVAPYNPDNGNFILDYKDQRYADKTTTPPTGLRYSYPGFSPNGMQLVDTDPDASSIVWSTGTGDGEEIVSSAYMYERPIPAASEPASYMIVHGTFYPLNARYYADGQPKDWKIEEREHPGTYLDLSAGVPCYYKVDFSDSEGAYAIFRNFRYHIRITDVAKAGAETAGEAGATGGTGDINQDTSVAGLTDISDGFGRIAVSHTGWTFVEGRAVFELKYKFIEDASLGDSSANNALASEGGPVTITIGSKTGPVNVLSTTLDSSIATETGVVLGDSNTGYIKVIGASTAKDAEGFRSIHFTVNTPDNSDLTTQTIHISGTAEGRILSRDVVYYLMPRQTMIVECLADVPHQDHPEDYVENVAGEGVNVRITIPKMLPESMFPLIFNLESDQLSITPNTAKYPEDNMPVANGKSICDGKTSSNSFHYVRTVSYEEYKGLQETLDGMVFTCHFKTNKAASASTIYVDNTYFNKGHDSFYNYSLYRFSGLSFSANTVAANTNVNFTFYLDGGDNTRPRTVQLKLDGLLPQNSAADGWGVIDPDDDLYSYTINSGNTATLALKTISAAAGYDNTFAVTLNAFESGSAVYHEASHGNVAQRISLDPTSCILHPGENKTVKATIWPASIGSTSTISWMSDDTSIATVDANGKVTAVASGITKITASCNSMAASCIVSVEGFRLTPKSTTLYIRNGIPDTQTLTVAMYPVRNVTWTSSDPAVATVDATGLVTAVSPGTTTITVTSEDGNYTDTCTVTVRRIRTFTIAINNTTNSFGTNNTTGNFTTDDGKTITVRFSAVRNRNGNYIEIDQNQTMTVSGVNMTNMTVTFQDNNHALISSVTPNTTWNISGNTGTWTGNANSVVFTGSRAGNAGSRRYCQFSSLVITYEE